MSWYELLIQHAGVVEVTAIQGDRIQVGLFDDPDAASAAAIALPGNVYTTFNAPKPHIRATNRMGCRRLKDDDIAFHRWLLFDFDPVRDTGMATEAQGLAARERTREAHHYLRSLGWPAPVSACSGNGFHLLYRCDLAADSGTKAMLFDLYRGLGDRFSDDAVKFDAMVRNPSRLTRAYGSMNCKGDGPARLSRVWARGGAEPVSFEQIQELALRLKPAEKPRHTVSHTKASGGGYVDWKRIDLVGWMHALGYLKTDLGGGNYGCECPWGDEHSTPPAHNYSDCIVMNGTHARRGFPLFFCHHDSCRHRWLPHLIGELGGAENYLLGGA
jgi:hypothetical protein